MKLVRAMCIAAAVVGATAAMPAFSKEMTGDEFMAKCAKPANSVDAGFCLGLIEGIDEGVEMGIIVDRVRDGKTTSDGLKTTYCYPDGITLGQTSDTLMAYIRNNPSERSKHISVLFVLAMEAQYPCSGS